LICLPGTTLTNVQRLKGDHDLGPATA